MKKTLAACVSAAVISCGGATSAYASQNNNSGTYASSIQSSKWSNISKAELLNDTNNSIFGLAGNFNAFVHNDFSMTGADEEGRLAAGGNVILKGNGVGAESPSNLNKQATLIVNGNYTGINSNISNGFGIVNGKVNSPNYNVTDYQKYYSCPNIINFNREFDELSILSSNINQAAISGEGKNVTINDPANSTKVINGTVGNSKVTGRKLEFKGNNSVYNIFNINASELSKVNEINFDIPSGAAAIVNVVGKNVVFPVGGIYLNGQSLEGHAHGTIGGEPNLVMWNLATAQKVSAKSSVEGSVLAPNADWEQPDKDTANGDIDGNMIVKSFSSNSGFEMHNFFFTGGAPGEIRVVKTSTWNDMRILSGVQFSLYKKNGNEWSLLQRREFSQAGDMNFINLSDGDYKLVENKTAQGNILLQNPIEFSLPLKKNSDSIGIKEGTSNNMIKSDTNFADFKGNGYMDANLDIYNYSEYTNIGRIKIKAISTDNKPLAGATFNVYKGDTTNEKNLVGVYTTGKDGSIVTAPYESGKYKIKQVTAPKGYESSSITEVVNIVGQIQNSGNRITNAKPIVNEKLINKPKADVNNDNKPKVVDHKTADKPKADVNKKVDNNKISNDDKPSVVDHKTTDKPKADVNKKVDNNKISNDDKPNVADHKTTDKPKADTNKKAESNQVNNDSKPSVVDHKTTDKPKADTNKKVDNNQANNDNKPSVVDHKTADKSKADTNKKVDNNQANNDNKPSIVDHKTTDKPKADVNKNTDSKQVNNDSKPKVVDHKTVDKPKADTNKKVDNNKISNDDKPSVVDHKTADKPKVDTNKKVDNNKTSNDDKPNVADHKTTDKPKVDVNKKTDSNQINNDNKSKVVDHKTTDKPKADVNKNTDSKQVNNDSKPSVVDHKTTDKPKADVNKKVDNNKVDNDNKPKADVNNDNKSKVVDHKTTDKTSSKPKVKIPEEPKIDVNAKPENQNVAHEINNKILSKNNAMKNINLENSTNTNDKVIVSKKDANANEQDNNISTINNLPDTGTTQKKNRGVAKVLLVLEFIGLGAIIMKRRKS